MLLPPLTKCRTATLSYATGAKNKNSWLKGSPRPKRVLEHVTYKVARISFWVTDGDDVKQIFKNQILN